MKKFFAIALTAVMAAGLAACGSSESSSSSAAESSSVAESSAAESSESSAAESSSVAESSAAESSASSEAAGEKTEVIVFAAASMTETLTEIADKYMEENPDVTVTLSFESSGTLKTQIEEGADCDLFISAGQKQMNALDIEADADTNPDQLDFIDHSTRINLLENKVTLSVPDGNPKGIESFDQLAELLKSGDVLMAMGNSDVPVGQYTQKILAYYGLDEQTLADSGVITYGSNVKEVTTQVKEGSVDCGVIYATDAYSAGLTVVDTATKDMCGQVIYPAAVLKNAPNADAAKAFLEYLQTEDSMKVFESVGFSAIAE